jgi:uncharacterized membrane protein
MDSGGLGFTLITIVGVILLGAVLFWAMLRNASQRKDIDRTEEATRELYKEEDAARDLSDDDVP